MIYPAPLKDGSRIAVTAPSAGVPEAMHPRLDYAISHLRNLGYDVVEGSCLRENEKHVSAPVIERVEELVGFLTDDSIDAIIPPWGGELAIELLPLLDYDQISLSKPKWLLGYSDTSTLLSAITAKCGWATAHGPNLLELIAEQSDALTASILQHLKAGSGEEFSQMSSNCYQENYVDYCEHPQSPLNLTEPTKWKLLAGDDDSVTFTGQLFGGCLDILVDLVGSEYFDLSRSNMAGKDKKSILYLENAELTPTGLTRALYGLKFRLPMEKVSGILIGRNAAPAIDDGGLSDVGVMKAAFSDLSCPVLYDVDIGHKPPNLLLVNGSTATVEYAQGRGSITQKLD